MRMSFFSDKKTRIGLILLLVLCYAVPTSRAVDACDVREKIGDQLYPPIPLKCKQGGVYNKDTERCNCIFAWTGRFCETCLEEPCIRKAQVTSVWPQSGNIQDTSAINFIGHGFPRTPKNSYQCLFNDTKVEGTWIDPTKVECKRPNKLFSNESYHIALIPTGLHRVIKHHEQLYFDYYDDCNVLCPTSCFESLCLNYTLPKHSICPETRIESYNLTESNPLSALLTSNTNQTASLISTSHPSIKINELNGLLLWNQPIGSNNPYLVKYQIIKEDCIQYMNAEIKIPVIYQPRVLSITKHKLSNLHRLMGYIKFNGSRAGAEKDLPVLLKIFEGQQFIEQFEITSKRRFFFADIYPYVNSKKDYLIFAEHPNSQISISPGLVFTNCLLDVQYEETLVIDNIHTLVYQIKTDSCGCGQWSAQVIWPRNLIRVNSQQISGKSSSPKIQIVISLDKSIRMNYDSMYMAINCDTSASYTARHKLVYKSNSRLKISPEWLDIYIDTSKESVTYVEVNVETKDQFLHANPKSTDIFPFFLVIPPTLSQLDNSTTQISYLFGLNANQQDPLIGTLKYPNPQEPIFSMPYRVEWTDQIPETLLLLTVMTNSIKQGEIVEITILSETKSKVFTKMVAINSPTTIRLPNRGFFELSITSDNFAPFTKLIGMISLNTTLDIMLDQPPSTYLTLNDDRIEFTEVDKNLERPKLIVEPNVIKNITDENIWLTFIYANGPENSMAMIRADTITTRAFQITNLPANVGISVGSGYRHRIKVIPNTDLKNLTSVVYKIDIPYVYTIPGIMKNLENTFSIVIDMRRNNEDTNFNIEPMEHILAQSTRIYDKCAPNLINKCKDRFRRLNFCSNAWIKYFDGNFRVASLKTLMTSILFQRSCYGYNYVPSPEESMELLRCIISVNMGQCQIERHLNNAMLKCTQKSPSLNSQTNLFNKLSKTLNISPFELCRFINGYYKQLFYLNELVPFGASILNESSFDTFVQAVNNKYITLNEVTAFQMNIDDMTLIRNWNQIYDVTSPDQTGSRSDLSYQLLSAFIETASELNYLSKKLANKDPPNLIDDLIRHIVMNANDMSNLVMIATASSEPKCIREGQDLQVRLFLQNLGNVIVENLEFRVKLKSSDSAQLKYLLKPAWIDSRTLKPGQNVTLSWTLTPIFKFRLSKQLIQTALIGISFKIEGERKWQEAKSNAFKIEPAETLRTIVLLYPNVTKKSDINTAPFSVQISVLNIGYSTIKQLSLLNIRPDISNTMFNGPVEFSLDSVRIDDKPQANQLDINIGELIPNASRSIFMNFSTLKEDGYMMNISFVCTVSENHFIDRHLSRQFYVRKQMKSTIYLVSESNDLYQLYSYETINSKLTSLNAAYLVQENPVEKNDNCFKSVVQAFALFDQSKSFDKPLFANSIWPSTINSSFTLVAIFQVFPNFDVMQRIVDLDNIWEIYTDDGKREINFIDMKPFTSASRIYYELVFANGKCKADLSFLQKNYHVYYPPELLSKYAIVAQIQAISPKTDQGSIEYKLLGTEASLPFAVLAENGAIILMNSTIIDDDPYCVVLVAENGNGRQTNATIQLGGRYQVNCSFDYSSQPLFEHVLGGAHNLPFDYTKAREEFLNNSIRTPLITTTEEPGDKWTITDVINPESTLPILTTTTTESVLVPDKILSSTSKKPIVEEIETTLMTTTKKVVSTTTVLPVFTAKITEGYTYNPKSQIELMTSSAESIDMACKKKDEMPMLQVLCDLSRSVFRTNA